MTNNDRSLIWLHISDLHFGHGQASHRFDQQGVTRNIIKDAEALLPTIGKPDLIVLTGDIAFSGNSKREYTAAQAWLQDLTTALKISPQQVIAVPGNHDVDRALATKGSGKDVHDNLRAGGRQIDELIEKPRLLKTIWPKLSAFSEFASNYLIGTAWGAASPFWTHRIDLPVGPLRIAALNTALLSFNNEDNPKNLALGRGQILKTIEKQSKDELLLVLMHHPPEWLKDGHDLTGRLQHVPHIMFCGHIHRESASIRENITGGGLLRFAAGAGHAEAGEAGQHAYSWGCLRSDGLQYFPRVWIDSEKCFAARPFPTGASLNGLNTFVPIEKLPSPLTTWLSSKASVKKTSANSRTTQPSPSLAKISQHPEKPASFQVLIAATNIDLEDARARAANYLRQAMGVTVVETSVSDIPDPSQFNLIILLQGWWWSDGALAKLYEATEPSKRVALIADENSDNWPPRKLVERGKQETIETFRASLIDPLYFSHPEQIPEKVGELVTSALEKARQSLGSEDWSLRPWERSYLAYRLPAWSAGRTAAGTPHLIDAEEATELYRPELYVPLDGISDRWLCGKDGRPELIPEKFKTSKNIAALQEQARRIPLGNWVSLRELPRIALEGAPGGGKTVFLTRIAAALGNYCLGRPAELEELELGNLRNTIGGLPIPVVLEATRIAEHNPKTHSALIDALGEELTAAPSSERPQQEQLQKELVAGLTEGRYLILVDALDEIADANKRSQTLQLLKGLAAPECFPRTRIVLTTRSARYTGSLAFGPQFEVVKAAPLSKDQVDQFCINWTAHRNRDDIYRSQLLSAISGLADQVTAESDESALTSNPLMLTAICMVFERYRNLPEDRARLCTLLVDDLCRSRRSEDLDHGWRLDDASKRDLLQRIALEMQKDGAQNWPESRARAVALDSLLATDKLRERRALRHLQWTADHTGLLRFHQPENGQEEVRFWHRLFREYLAASRLAQEDLTVRDLANYLYEQKWLVNPFWEDVIRLLPRVLGTWEKASGFVERLRELAADKPEHRGRLLGLAAAGIIESRDLFPRFDVDTLAIEMANIYKTEGSAWPARDRALFLEGLGRLSPSGDPRLEKETWIWIEAPAKLLSAYLSRSRKIKLKIPDKSFFISWCPVTVQGYRSFVDASDCFDAQWWGHADIRDRSTIKNREPQSWLKQQRHPNRPIVNVNWFEALAYCKWLTSRRNDPDFVVRLPTELEWIAAAHALFGTLSRQAMERPGREDAAWANWRGAGIGHVTPVGTFPQGTRQGVADLFGNTYELCTDPVPGNVSEHSSAPLLSGQMFIERPSSHPKRDFTLVFRGGACFDEQLWLRLSCSASGGFFFGGFRCVLVSRAAAMVEK